MDDEYAMQHENNFSYTFQCPFFPPGEKEAWIFVVDCWVSFSYPLFICAVLFYIHIQSSSEDMFLFTFLKERGRKRNFDERETLIRYLPHAS